MSDGSQFSGRGFPKRSRLLTTADYTAIFKQARFRVSCRCFLILASDGASGPDCRPRLGLVVARRNVPKAVARNRIRRIIREFFRHNGEILAGLDLIVLVRKDADKLTNPQLSRKLETLWQQLHRRRHKDRSRTCVTPSIE